jgi:hypothetical protein
MPAPRIIAAVVALAVSAPALAQPTCELDRATRALAVEVERLRSPGVSGPADVSSPVEEAARMLLLSPCDTSPVPALSFAAIDLALARAAWSRGARAQEDNRLAHQPSHWRTTDSGRRNSQ